MFVFDFATVEGRPQQAAEWINGHRDRVAGLAASAWELNAGNWLSEIDSAGTFLARLGPSVNANNARRFPMDWSVGERSSLVALLSGDLSVEPFAAGLSHLEIQGTCRDLVRLMTGVEDQYTRKAMLHIVRSFLGSLADEISD